MFDRITIITFAIFRRRFNVVFITFTFVLIDKIILYVIEKNILNNENIINVNCRNIFDIFVVVDEMFDIDDFKFQR